MPECRCGFPFVWAGFDKLWRIPSAQQYGAKCACCVSIRTCQMVKKCQYRQERSEDILYRVRELGPTNHVKGMLWFNGSCWCCVNSKSLFACQNTDVDFPFVWAGFDKLWRIPSVQQYSAKCACCVSKRTCQMVKKCQYRQERSEDVLYRVRELGPTNHVKGMLCFNGSCWCCVNSKSLFACQNADVDFRSFGLALTMLWRIPSAQQYGAKCACVSKRTWSRNVNTVVSELGS